MTTRSTPLHSSGARRKSRARFTAALGVALFFLLAIHSGYAGSATWNANPGSADWNTAANWTPATVPNGTRDSATFDVSSVTNVTQSFATAVSQLP